MRICFIVMGTPKAKGRPKFSHAGKFAKAYTPKETVDYENLVRLEYERQCEGLFFAEEPLRAYVKAYFPIPKSTSKKKKEMMQNGKIYHTKKPDGDNVLKIIFDALNEIAYKDDSQICIETIEKRYAELPRVEVMIESINGGESDGL